MTRKELLEPSKLGHIFTDNPVYQKRGSCCIKEEYTTEKEDMPSNNTDAEATVRTRWRIDKEIRFSEGKTGSILYA